MTNKHNMERNNAPKPSGAKTKKDERVKCFVWLYNEHERRRERKGKRENNYNRRHRRNCLMNIAINTCTV